MVFFVGYERDSKKGFDHCYKLSLYKLRSPCHNQYRKSILDLSCRNETATLLNFSELMWVEEITKELNK